MQAVIKQPVNHVRLADVVMEPGAGLREVGLNGVKHANRCAWIIEEVPERGDEIVKVLSHVVLDKMQCLHRRAAAEPVVVPEVRQIAADVLVHPGLRGLKVWRVNPEYPGAADDCREEPVDIVGSQDEEHPADRLLKYLEQRVGGSLSHVLRVVDYDELADAEPRCLVDEPPDPAHRVD